MGEVCLAEVEVGMWSALRLGWKLSGLRRTGGTWPQVPAAWVEAWKGTWLCKCKVGIYGLAFSR